MKNNILTIAIILIGLGIAVFLYQYLTLPEGEEPESEKTETPLVIETAEEGEGPEMKEEEEVLKETLLVKDDFEIISPPGWQEVLDSPETLAIAVDVREEVTDEKAKEMGFQTYFSIKNDNLGNYAMNNIDEYIESTKVSLIQTYPDIEFTHEEQGIIDGYNVFYIECESIQQEIAFKTLLVFVEGKDDIIWAISFNALQDSWPNYRDLFYQTAESFKLK